MTPEVDFLLRVVGNSGTMAAWSCMAANLTYRAFFRSGLELRTAFLATRPFWFGIGLAGAAWSETGRALSVWLDITSKAAEMMASPEDYMFGATAAAFKVLFAIVVIAASTPAENATAWERYHGPAISTVLLTLAVSVWQVVLWSPPLV